jgi:2-polyprenyl-3-methyl-5-hydroxy-6-metoxy-1,4-benzoquinol methylase
MNNIIWDSLSSDAPLTTERMKEVEYNDNQSAISHMVDVLPHIDRLFNYHHWNTELRFLDVGCRSGSGTALVADLHHGTNSWIKFTATGIELEPYWADYARFRFPNVRYIVGDVFLHEERYDLITCNHVIEHFTNPIPIVEKMKSVCDGFVITSTPWKEMTLIPEHLSRFDEVMLHYLKPSEWHVVTNRSWRVRGDCLIMIFDCRK